MTFRFETTLRDGDTVVVYATHTGSGDEVELSSIWRADDPARLDVDVDRQDLASLQREAEDEGIRALARADAAYWMADMDYWEATWSWSE